MATNVATLYINGAVVATGAATANLEIGDNWKIGARIGSTTTGARPLKGQVDEFYIFKRALNLGEIQTLVNTPALPTGAPLVSGNLSIYYSFDSFHSEDLAGTTDQRGDARRLDGIGNRLNRMDIGSIERPNDFDPNNPIAATIDPGDIDVNITTVATGLKSPSLVLNANDGSGRVFVADQTGLVYLVVNGVLQGTPFMDLTSYLAGDLFGNNERGLSGMAFHPDFANVGTDGYGKIYTMFDENDGDLSDEPPADFTHWPLDPGQEGQNQSVLREWTMNNITDNVFSGTMRELMRIDQAHNAHSAGMIEFGPDGYLYVALGDGGIHDDQGVGHDPYTGNASNLGWIYGKILRIDPMGNNSANGKYGIPVDNPFVSDPDALNEIFFYGLRNPFRFSFGRDAAGNKTNQIIIGDTGQDDIEEIDLADITTDAGGHFGWNTKEGTFNFFPGPESGPDERGRAIPAVLDSPSVSSTPSSNGITAPMVKGLRQSAGSSTKEI